MVEAEASVKGMGILKQIGVDSEYLGFSKVLMSQWYLTYEKLCQKGVVRKPFFL